MRDAYHEDLLDFVRHGKLDGYELTDEELARLLELWRWTVWTRREFPSGIDHDVLEAAKALQQRLAHKHNIEVEYNTALLLKQEIEPLMHLRVLLDVPRALRYFLSVRGIVAMFRSLRRVRRYRRIEPARGRDGERIGYPRTALDDAKLNAPDLLKRPYWRQLSPYSFEQRKRHNVWF